MRLPHHHGKVPGYFTGPIGRQSLDFNFHILRKKFSYKHRSLKKMCRDHPFPKIGRQVPRSLHHPFGIFSRHLIPGQPGSSRQNRLLDIYQAKVLAVGYAVAHIQEYGITQVSKRTATFPPTKYPLRHQIINNLMAQSTEKVADAAIRIWE